MDKIQVAVRVRPLNRRELELGVQNVVEVAGNQILLDQQLSLEKASESRKSAKTFAFDHCFDSSNPDAPEFATQETIFNNLGKGLLDNAFKGYNACIFAYGQTGSGKSYTMMGSQGNPGIIPRLCNALFERISLIEDPNLQCKVEVSYMEIYNEKVHDLLDPKANKQSLKVREHIVLGPYVDGLSQLAVKSFQDIDLLMAEGNKSRTVAATNMNSESSRSHAVFSVILTQSLIDPVTGVEGEKVSKMSLVDLAGSERAVKTGAVGDRLKEGSNINKSLTTLGLVISKLADQSTLKGKDKFVPYRDSVLTWLLKDNLGGNSKTVMVAAISPASENYEETLSTLRYADRAKRIVNHAVINEDPNARIIRELREEVEQLRELLMSASHREEISEKISESEKLMKGLSETWEEKLEKTERLQHERQHALEKMGISVQASGIKVEKNKFYLVNLNADPSLNELLVYYLKDCTLVGRSDSPVKQDIQLSGLGINPEHCVLEIEDNALFMTPIDGSACFVNGSPVFEKCLLANGDRLLWGNNHFFRLNCPRTTWKTTGTSSDPQTPAQAIDYNFAREELMMKDSSNNTIQAAIDRLERQHEEDKQVALERQRQEYERQFLQLRNILSPSTPYAPYLPFDPFRSRGSVGTPTSQSRVERWAQERDETFRRSLALLREEIVKANALVREANFLSEEMGRQTLFSVTLQIPPQNLTPNRRRGAFVSEPAILVKRKGNADQVWSLEKLENKLVDMRDLYSDIKDSGFSLDGDLPNADVDPFYENQINHSLIGVANLYLEVLFHDVKLSYHVPIISQQGEVAGRLLVEISRVAGQLPADRIVEAVSEYSEDSGNDLDELEAEVSKIVVKYPYHRSCLIAIVKYLGYKFEKLLPGSHVNRLVRARSKGACGTKVSREKDFVPRLVEQPIARTSVPVTVKEASGLPPSLSHFVFCQYCFWDSPLIVVPPIETNRDYWGYHRKAKDVIKFDHTREFELVITEDFLEHSAEGALSFEVWGHRSSGFTAGSEMWGVENQIAKARSLADRWREVSRRVELWAEIHELGDTGEYIPVEVQPRNDVFTGGIIQLRQGQQRRIAVRVQPVTDSDKTEQDIEREKSLVDQWVGLTEERNAVLLPNPGSCVPGSPSHPEWVPKPGLEQHVPVLFLDLNPDDLSISESYYQDNSVAGQNSILPKEYNGKFFSIPILRQGEKDVSAVAAWDSSIHDCVNLNRVTQSNERVYLIVKATVRLSSPAPVDLILRKRLCINIYKKQSLTEKLFKRIVRADELHQCGVIYEIVSNVPKASEELEDRESLAQLAASEDSGMPTEDGESYIEKYTRGVSAVESLLALDRLRQSVATKELLQASGKGFIRKTASVPNISHLFRLGEDDSPIRSESFADLNGSFSSEPGFTSRERQRSGSLKGNEMPRPTFLNLNLNLNGSRLQSPGCGAKCRSC
ncbi:hypothetical protein QYM36_018247 [Artemia franciscana]|uniref:Kinesin-like protein KIF13A n=1 Tax=Artemia franciscana TaxID=6661 RepID=A0AA88HDB2_ARTSF|nr:hypothetical protein QYM36_018247 [Artemia franciscana]